MSAVIAATVVSWSLLALSLLLCRAFRLLPIKHLLPMTAVLMTEAVLSSKAFFSGNETFLRQFSAPALTFNLAFLLLITLLVFRAASSNYLAGALLMIAVNGCRAIRDNLGHSLFRYMLAPIIRLIWIAEVNGLENVPKGGACLVALNHESYFDFICFTAVVERRIHYLAAEKFFSHPFWKWVVRGMGCIKVDRSSRFNISAMREINNVVTNERLVGIFPEGTRSPDGRLMRGKPGVAYLAVTTGIPVIPVGLIGTYEIMSRDDRLPRLRKAVINIGDPVMFHKEADVRMAADHFQKITDEIMMRIAGLTGESYPSRGTADV